MHFQEAVIHSKRAAVHIRTGNWTEYPFLTFLNAAGIYLKSKALVQFWLSSTITHKITVMAHISFSSWDSALLVEIFMYWQDSYTFLCSYRHCFMSKRIVLGEGTTHRMLLGQTLPCTEKASARSTTCTVSAEMINCTQVSLHQSTGHRSGGAVCRGKVKHV